jgi:ethanolamine ammonia-lyase small subunit
MSQPPKPTGEDPWALLREHTAARIGLARTGASLATTPLLEFRLAHARARDAVHAPLDEPRLAADLAAVSQSVLVVASAAEDRQQYLMRPDLGRRLAADSGSALVANAPGSCDIAFIVTDGLSARAVQSHAGPLLTLLLPELAHDKFSIAPLTIAHRGRVALGDTIATILNADIAVVLIGERPGLSAPDSMGAYVTWKPSAQATDADRNCISNIRPEGLGYADAAFTLSHLLRTMRMQRMSGVQLKATADRLLIER